jgi:hypothetical protein
MMTFTYPTSLKNSMPKEEESKQLKEDENDYEGSSAPSHVFPNQQQEQLPLSEPFLSFPLL